MKKTEAPEVDERAAVQAEDDNLACLEREAGETVLTVKGRTEAVHPEIGAAAARNDKVAVAALSAEAAALPAQLRAAEAAYEGIRAARAPISARLGALNRERGVTNLSARKSIVETSAAENAARITGATETLGVLIAERQGIEAEIDSLRRQLAQYGVNSAPIPRVHDIVAEGSRLLRTRNRYDTVELRIPVPV